MIKKVASKILDNKFGFFGIMIIVVFLITSLFASTLSPYDANLVKLENRLIAPGELSESGDYHILGSDSLGRDVLSRLIYGARISLVISIVAAIISLVIGSVLGLFSGLYRGWLDTII